MSNQWTCPQCNHQNPDEMRFCPNCGAMKPVPEEAPQASGEVVKIDRRLLWGAVIGLWLIGCLILAVGGSIWLSRKGRDGEAAQIVAQEVSSAETATTAPPTETASPEPTATPTLTSTPTPVETPTPSPTPTPRASGGDSLTGSAAATPASNANATATPTSRSRDSFPSPTATATPTSTPTLTPAPKPVAVPPTSTPVSAPNCPSTGVQITSPRPGTRFTRRYNFIIGTANINRFHHWKIDYSTDPNGGWQYLLERDYPVENDKLIMLDASTVPRGPYGLRLTVVEDTGNYPEPCEVWYTNGY